MSVRSIRPSSRKRIREVMLVAEALHERRIAEIARAHRR